MGMFEFFSFVLSSFVRVQPISFVFFSIVKKIISFLFKIIVHFPSVSFDFSLNDRSVKSLVQEKTIFSKICLEKSVLISKKVAL